MTTEQTAINSRALLAAAAKLESAGFNGDAYRFVEGLVVSVLSDGYRRLEPPPAPRGPGASRAAIESAKAAAEAAVRAVKEAREQPKESDR